MTAGPVIALIDGEHHPAAVRDALDRLERSRGLAGVVFCGGEEKVPAGALERTEEHYGRSVETDSPPDALRRLAARAVAVVDIGDEPSLSPTPRFRLAAHALHLGLVYEAPGTRLAPPRYQQVEFGGPKLAVIGTAKRTGKTAVAGHWASLIRDRGAEPVIVCMGRGGPPEPRLARADMGLGELVGLTEDGGHAASDYLEGAALAGVTTVGCGRIGGGLAGEPHESNVAEGARLAASVHPEVLIFEGSGACIPPVEVDRTACVVGDPDGALEALGPYRLLRSQLALVAGDESLARGVERWCERVVRFELRPEPAEEVPEGARVALFSTSTTPCDGFEPVVASRNLARRGALAADLDRAAAECCDVYLTELKAAAIDTVAVHARREEASVIFLRNRPVGIDGDLDAALLELYADVA